MARVLVLLTAVSLGVSGCGQDDPGRPASTERTAQAEQPEPVEGSAKQAAHDVPDRACDGVETLFSHLRTQSAGWHPEQQPFDPAMAAAVRELAQDLSAKGREATSQPVRVQVAANVTALNRLGVAMSGGKDAPRVLAAISDMRVKYAALKAACDPDSEPSADTTPSTPSTPSTPRSQPTTAAKPERSGPTCRHVQDVMTTLGADLAAWSPEADPFDKAAAAKWRGFGDQLAALAPRARSAQERAAIEETARAFDGIADAMGSHRRRAVKDSIRKAGLAYLDIHRECSLS